MGATAVKQIKEKDEQLNSEKIRVQFDFDKPSIDKFDEIKRAMGATTRAEVFRAAMKLLSTVLEAEERGEKLYLREKNGDYIQLMPLF